MIYSGGCKHERGVGIILDENTSRFLFGYWCASDRVMIIKLNAKPFNMVIMHVYAPTADSEESELERLYVEMEEAIKQCNLPN